MDRKRSASSLELIGASVCVYGYMPVWPVTLEALTFQSGLCCCEKSSRPPRLVWITGSNAFLPDLAIQQDRIAAPRLYHVPPELARFQISSSTGIHHRCL